MAQLIEEGLAALGQIVQGAVGAEVTEIVNEEKAHIQHALHSAWERGKISFEEYFQRLEDLILDAMDESGEEKINPLKRKEPPNVKFRNPKKKNDIKWIRQSNGLGRKSRLQRKVEEEDFVKIGSFMDRFSTTLIVPRIKVVKRKRKRSFR